MNSEGTMREFVVFAFEEPTSKRTIEGSKCRWFYTPSLDNRPRARPYEQAQKVPAALKVGAVWVAALAESATVRKVLVESVGAVGALVSGPEMVRAAPYVSVIPFTAT